MTQIPSQMTQMFLHTGFNEEGSHQTEPMAPRFRFPYGARCSIYNLPVVKMLKPGERLFITEGCSDCWAMLSAGHKAIAIPSATLLKPEDKQLLADIERQYQVEFHMFPDQGCAGRKPLPATQGDSAPAGAPPVATRMQGFQRVLSEKLLPFLGRR